MNRQQRKIDTLKRENWHVQWKLTPNCAKLLRILENLTFRVSRARYQSSGRKVIGLTQSYLKQLVNLCVYMCLFVCLAGRPLVCHEKQEKFWCGNFWKLGTESAQFLFLHFLGEITSSCVSQVHIWGQSADRFQKRIFKLSCHVCQGSTVLRLQLREVPSNSIPQHGDL